MTGTLTMADVERLRALATSSEEHVILDMDEDAFHGFYERTARPLWAYLSRVAGPAEADDLLQETYYRFLRARGRYQGEAHRRNALFAIATNLARDRARRRRADPVAAARDSADDSTIAAVVVPSPEARHDLSRAMEQMAPRERGLLWLAYGQGWSHREIAGVLGLSAGSVKPLLFRARRKLASLLQGNTAGKEGAR
ncbi:MAG: RNA polymerase sigma factor [Acidobacteriota bacterium]